MGSHSSVNHVSNETKQKPVLALLTLFLCLLDRFRALGLGRQKAVSDQERCGVILSEVLGAESPLYHLGVTQVHVSAQRTGMHEKERPLLG